MSLTSPRAYDDAMESERGQSAAVSAVVAMARITGQIIDRREVGEAGLSMTDKPQPIIFAMGTEGYLNLVAKLMGGDAPPAAADAPMVARMAKLGIVPGKPFEMGKLDPAMSAFSVAIGGKADMPCCTA